MTPFSLKFVPSLPQELLVTGYKCTAAPPHSEFLVRFRESHLGPQKGEPPGQKRLVEFWLARSAAQELLTGARVTGPVKIGVGKEGEPLFPEGIAGGLSHTGDEGLQFGAAIVGPSSAFEAVSIDLEWLDRPLRGTLESLCGKICHPEEKAWVYEASEEEGRLRRIFTVFSAKECAFKALYVRYGAPVRFLDVRVEVSPSGEGRMIFLVNVGTRYTAGDSVPIFAGEVPEERVIGTALAIPRRK